MAAPPTEACRAHLLDSVRRVAGEVDPASPSTMTCLILSGGVDTSAILAASEEIGLTYDHAVTVIVSSTDPDDPSRTVSGPDEAYSIAAAARFDRSLSPGRHHIVRVSSEDLVDRYLPRCIEALECYDGMTLRNSLVIAAAFEKVRELCPPSVATAHVVVGDGADELFGGYSFMWGTPGTDDLDEWKTKRDSMCRKWTFATEDLARSYGRPADDKGGRPALALRVHAPFTDPEFVEWALASTTKLDCISYDEHEIQLVHGGPYEKHTTGKVCLRRAFATPSSWRRKDPIEVGSGATVLGKDRYWGGLLGDEEFEAEAARLREERGYRIRTKENLINFRIFDRLFLRDAAANGAGEEGIVVQGRRRLPIGRGCAGCCFDIGEELFCRICGEYPAQRIVDAMRASLAS